jgi:hypothetical protein
VMEERGRDEETSKERGEGGERGEGKRLYLDLFGCHFSEPSPDHVPNKLKQTVPSVLKFGFNCPPAEFPVPEFPTPEFPAPPAPEQKKTFGG